MPTTGASSPEGVDFTTITAMSDELAEALLAVIADGDSAETVGMYRGFTLADLTSEDLSAGAQFHSDCKMSGYQKGREVRMFLEGLFRGLHEGFHFVGAPIPRAEATGSTATFIIGYNLGYSLGRAGRKQEIERSGRVSDRAFQHFLNRFGISIVEERTSSSTDTHTRDPQLTNGRMNMSGKSQPSIPTTLTGTGADVAAAEALIQGGGKKDKKDKKDKKAKTDYKPGINWVKVGKVSAIAAAGIAAAAGGGFACYNLGKKNGLAAGMPSTNQLA